MLRTQPNYLGPNKNLSKRIDQDTYTWHYMPLTSKLKGKYKYEN